MIPPGKTHSVRLCATFVRTVNVPGRYGDGYGGLGLSLVVTPRKSGGLSKTRAQAVSPNGRKTSLGLGSYPVTTLAMAREKALANARAIAEGRDPRRRMQQVPTWTSRSRPQGRRLAPLRSQRPFVPPVWIEPNVFGRLGGAETPAALRPAVGSASAFLIPCPARPCGTRRRAR